jgi:hypothetical protein
MKLNVKQYFWVVLLLVVLVILGSFVNVQYREVSYTYRLAEKTSWGRSPKSGSSPKFEFGLIGDLPYNSEEEAKFANLMRDMNQADLAFVIHDGDFKSGSSVCSDKVFAQRLALFQISEHPFIFIPGDNEWTDCHRQNNGSYDPVERLAKLREMFFSGDKSLGKQTIRLTRQSQQHQYRKFRENVRWLHKNILFVGLNVTGSNNNFGRNSESDAEYFERNSANLAWMQESFAVAKKQQLIALILIIQANPGFDLPVDNPNRTGFNDFIAALEKETLNFNNRPVVLVHGDSHYFRIDKPLMSVNKRRIENFTRVETFGSPDVHWLRAIIDPADPNLLRFQQEIVNGNLVNHQLPRK